MMNVTIKTMDIFAQVVKEAVEVTLNKALTCLFCIFL